MSFSEVQKRWDRLCRDAKLATTYMRKVENGFYAFRDGSQNVEPPVDYWTLLDQALDTATMIVEVLPADFFAATVMADPLGIRGDTPDSEWSHSMADGPLEAAQNLVKLIEARKSLRVRMALIEKLEATEGRTPEEATAFKAKARELRARMEEA